MSKQDIFQFLGSSFIGILLFGIGFYMGYRVQSVNSFDPNNEIETAAQQAQQEMLSAGTTNIEREYVDVPEVFWVAPGGESNCPASHPLKGKITSTGNLFYSPEHKRYKRVTAELCFANKEYATSSGFFEKK